MLKLLVTELLMATQLLSWSGESLYLCLCENSTICRDADLAACRCCATSDYGDEHDADCASPAETAYGDSCCPGDSSHKHSHESELNQCESGSCPCAHIQILYQQAPSVSAAFCGASAGRVAALSALPGDDCAFRGSLAVTDPLSGGAPAGPPSFSLALVALTVLRC